MAAGKEECLKSLDDDCTKLRTMYDSCFNKWFSEEFLKGVQSDHHSVCGDLFNSYLKCLKAGLDKKGLNMPELYENILNTEKESVPQ